MFHSSGDLFFTDPPYGLAKQMEDKEKDLPFQGVYRLDTKGKVHLLYDKMERPNGIGLSPDEKTLYVANSHGPRPVIMAFDVKPDRSVANPRIFFNGAELLAQEARPQGRLRRHGHRQAGQPVRDRARAACWSSPPTASTSAPS